MNRIICLSFMFVVSSGCSQSDPGDGDVPGEIQSASDTKVHQLSDGELIREEYDGATYFYLISSDAKDYEMVPDGLSVTMDEKQTGTTPRPEQGYVCACIEKVPGDGLEITRFRMGPDKLEEVIASLGESTSVYDLYRNRE